MSGFYDSKTPNYTDEAHEIDARVDVAARWGAIALAGAAAAALGLWAAAPAGAASITEISEFDRSLNPVPFRLDDFTGVGPCGSGGSVEGCAPKMVGPQQERFGRNVGEVDSQDFSEIVWAPKWQTERDKVQISISDMQDMRWTDRVELALLDPTSGIVAAVWESNARRSNGHLNFFELAFDKAVRKMTLRIRMIGEQPGRGVSNDGVGVGVCK